MIGHIYAVDAQQANISAASRLLQFTAAAAVVSLIERAYITQSNVTTSEQLEGQLARYATAGAGGTAVTPRPLNPSTPAAVTTVVEGPGAGTTATVLWTLGFNSLIGMLWTPANDDEVIVLGGSDVAQLELTAAGATGANLRFGATIREIG